MNDISVAIWDRDGNNFNNIATSEFWKWHPQLKWKKKMQKVTMSLLCGIQANDNNSNTG